MKKTCENPVKQAPPFHTVFHIVVCEINSEKHVKMGTDKTEVDHVEKDVK